MFSVTAIPVATSLWEYCTATSFTFGCFLSPSLKPCSRCMLVAAPGTKGISATLPWSPINSHRTSAAFFAAATLSVATKDFGMSESTPESIVIIGMPAAAAFSTTGTSP